MRASRRAVVTTPRLGVRPPSIRLAQSSIRSAPSSCAARRLSMPSTANLDLYGRLRWKDRGADSRRRPRQRYPLLVDEHRDLLGSPLLGHHADFDGRRLLRRQGRHDPGRRERLPRRNLCGPEKLSRAGLSQTHPLQQARQRRPLRSLGTAGALHRRDASVIQIVASSDVK
jgi:hypothetical protein